ncbi:hypothetical protein B0H10DRAFT_1968777 [Mycena sp. CBHHK59/15]|nr:hypothetical protein B0H10DRAFT_1968777 [Mycena sp. CBHHK59/15]
MSSITLRRCTIDWKTGKTLYARIIEEAQAMGETYLSAHNIDVSFFCTDPNAKGRWYTIHGKLHSRDWFQSPGNLYGGLPQETSCPYNDANTKSHRMVLALRCPTGEPDELCTMFQDGAAVCDALRMADEKVELENNENFMVMDIVHCMGDTVDNIIILLRLHPTYEVPYSRGSYTLTSAPSTPQRRVMRVGSTTTSSETSKNAGDVEMAVLPQVAERKVGDTYPPSTLSDVQGPAFQFEKAVLTQRDYHNLNSNLIAPVPTMPSPRDTPFSPEKRPRDEVTDAAFNNFSASSPSPSQRRRRH